MDKRQVFKIIAIIAAIGLAFTAVSFVTSRISFNRVQTMNIIREIRKNITLTHVKKLDRKIENNSKIVTVLIENLIINILMSDFGEDGSSEYLMDEYVLVYD